MSMVNIGASDSPSKLTAIQEGDVQPNAVDLRIGKIFAVSDAEFVIDENQKTHRGSIEIAPDSEGYFHLEPGHYEVVMENEISVAEGEAGFVITRSTLNRNGVFLTSGLYDSGYEGVMAGMMHVNIGPMKIAKGTRVGQYLNWVAESVSLYDGDYGHGKAHDQKYGVEDESQLINN